MLLNKKAVHWLMASYLYYVAFEESPLSDAEFDEYNKDLLDNYGDWDIHADIITKDMLKAGSAYNLRVHDYHLITRYCAFEWLRDNNEVKDENTKA